MIAVLVVFNGLFAPGSMSVLPALTSEDPVTWCRHRVLAVLSWRALKFA